MALEYRFLLKLVSIADNRHGELMEFFLIIEPRSGRNKWLDVFEQTEAGEPPIVHKTNNVLEAQRMARSIYRSGGIVTIEDLAPEPEEGALEGEEQASDAGPSIEMFEDAPMSKPSRMSRASLAASAAPRSASKAAAAAPASAEPASDEPTSAKPSSDAPHQARAVIHHHHVSSHGRVPPYTLGRMLEDLRYSAFIKDTLGMRALFEDNAVMVIRSQELQLHEPIQIGDELAMDLRMVGSGETSVQLGHRIWRTRDDALIGRATITGVYLNAKRRPAKLPEGVADRITADDAHAAPERLDAKPPRNAWKLKLTVRPSDLDLLNHVNHGHVIRMMDDARLLAVNADAYLKKAGDLSGHVTRCVVNYEREMLLGDELTIATWSDAAGVARFEIRRGRTVTARGLFTIG